MSNALFYSSKIVGSPNLETSVAEQEILPYSVVNFELMNDAACNISVNGSDYVYIRANQGYKSTMEDFIVNSVKIQQDNITYNWIASKRG